MTIRALVIDAPLIGSEHEKGALLLGGNRVFKLASKGEHFQDPTRQIVRTLRRLKQRRRSQRVYERDITGGLIGRGCRRR